MSAVQVFLTETAAVMVTDGVTYDESNRIISIRPKAHALANLNCVIAVRGPQDFADDIVPRLAKTFASFEELVDNLALSAEIVWDAAPAEVQEYGGCELYVVGWSHERGRAEGWFTSNVPAYGAPWLLRAIDGFACAPGVELEETPDDLVSTAVAIAERQRQWRDENGNGGVGGFLMLSAVMPDRVEQSIIHRWDDAFGDCLGDAA